MPSKYEWRKLVYQKNIFVVIEPEKALLNELPNQSEGLAARVNFLQSFVFLLFRWLLYQSDGCFFHGRSWFVSLPSSSVNEKRTRGKEHFSFHSHVSFTSSKADQQKNLALVVLPDNLSSTPVREVLSYSFYAISLRLRLSLSWIVCKHSSFASVITSYFYLETYFFTGSFQCSPLLAAMKNFPCATKPSSCAE